MKITLIIEQDDGTVITAMGHISEEQLEDLKQQRVGPSDVPYYHINLN